MFPKKVSLISLVNPHEASVFARLWEDVINTNCHSHSVWQEPFMQALTGEKAEKQGFALAAVWSINMVVGSYCFPRYVAALAARAEHDALRHGLLENAWDESGGHGHTNRSHFWLAVKLVRLLGILDNEIERIQPLKEAQAYTDEHFRQCTSGDFGFALGMICLIEEFTTKEFTAVFKAFLRSCRAEMGIEPNEFILKGGAEYFTANISDDERHRQEMPRLVATWLHGNGIDLNNMSEVWDALEPVRAGIKYSADLRQEFFRGIYNFVASDKNMRDLVVSPVFH
jgi:pyrroloquinoline quinone (PQQ) biosynthesis protein C